METTLENTNCKYWFLNRTWHCGAHSDSLVSNFSPLLLQSNFLSHTEPTLRWWDLQSGLPFQPLPKLIWLKRSFRNWQQVQIKVTFPLKGNRYLRERENLAFRIVVKWKAFWYFFATDFKPSCSWVFWKSKRQDHMVLRGNGLVGDKGKNKLKSGWSFRSWRKINRKLC